MEKVNRLLSAYYEAVKQGEKRRAAVLCKMLWKMGIVVYPD